MTPAQAVFLLAIVAVILSIGKNDDDKLEISMIAAFLAFLAMLWGN